MERLVLPMRWSSTEATPGQSAGNAQRREARHDGLAPVAFKEHALFFEPKWELWGDEPDLCRTVFSSETRKLLALQLALPDTLGVFGDGQSLTVYSAQWRDRNDVAGAIDQSRRLAKSAFRVEI